MPYRRLAGGSDLDNRRSADGVAGLLVESRRVRKRIFGGGVAAAQRRQYDVAPDGRFLINTVLVNAAAPITLLQNWQPEAKK